MLEAVLILVLALTAAIGGGIVRVRKPSGGFSVLVRFGPYRLRFGTWTYNGTGSLNPCESARVRRIVCQVWKTGARPGESFYSARGIDLERWNRAALENAYRFHIYARCQSHGRDIWECRAQGCAPNLVTGRFGFGFPRFVCQDTGNV
jgi:hypothetical protein